MNSATAHRGGAPVGYLSELAPVEAAAVLYLRLWCDGPDARSRVQSDFQDLLGRTGAGPALDTFGAICELCTRHGRRPLMRHHVDCKCLGADESCFANFIGYASEGARDDALLIATTMVRPDMAAALAGLAEEFGLALRRMTLNCGALRPAATPMTLH